MTSIPQRTSAAVHPTMALLRLLAYDHDLLPVPSATVPACRGLFSDVEQLVKALLPKLVAYAWCYSAE